MGVTDTQSYSLVIRDVFFDAIAGDPCKFACNNAPLRGEFRIQFRPLLTWCVSVLPFGPAGPGSQG